MGAVNPPAWGIAAVLVVGVALVVAGWWFDRRRHRRRQSELTSPPGRTLPGLPPTADPPRYTTEDEILATNLPDPTESQLALLNRRDEAATLPGGVADGRFLNHPRKGLGILLQPSVLVSDGRIEAQRDVLTALAGARRRGTGLVWVAPEFSRDALGTLHANAVTAKVPNLPVELGDPGLLRRAAALTGGRMVTASDLAASYLPDPAWGTCDGWIADIDDSWIVPPADTTVAR